MEFLAVYLMASSRNGTLYTGVTSNLIARVWTHRMGLVEGFTKDYHIKHLVWYEPHQSVEAAIQREKAIKRWRRSWKLEAIEKMNPEWIDLWPGISGDFELTVGGAGGVDAMMRVLKVQPWEK